MGVCGRNLEPLVCRSLYSRFTKVYIISVSTLNNGSMNPPKNEESLVRLSPFQLKIAWFRE
ncbi:hypothetical protein P3T76_003322 [Phytophthora citrophthora]|uniref:Uncharacterized protein n=1 Tax=Phytophthora citrophthora TaxID=4793 RepID=A0AAD9GTE6_9STRA|nr:hypothetical protein P3T76_003322 [Phytophthora citrophthora]